MQRGCELGDAASCNDLGYMHLDGRGTAQDAARAAALFRAACRRGLMRGCGSLAYLYQTGNGVAQSHEEARRLNTKACGEDGPSCANLGFMLQTGLGGPPDPAGAAQIYAKACELRDPLGCSNLGTLLADGSGVDRNDDAAVPLLQIGCADKIGEACRYLADFHDAGRGKLPRSDVMRDYYCSKAVEFGEHVECASPLVPTK